MPPHLRLNVPRYALDLEIELLPDLAPNTVAALRAALPVTGLVTTESHYGSNVCLRLPGILGPVLPENATIFPAPGDVFIFMSDHGAELVAYYQRMGGHVPAGTPFDARGAKAGNRVGFITNLSPTVREAATRVWSEGAAFGAAGRVDSAVVITTRDDREAAQAEIESRREAWHRQTWREHGGQPPGQGRRIVLRVPEYDAHTEIQVAFDLAPDTCENLWNHLPISLTLMHGRYSGPEVFTNAAEVGQYWQWTAKAENQVAYPIPGDMVLYIGPPARLQLNYFHDRGSIPFGIPRPEVGNLAGSSVGDFSRFAEACWRTGYEGWKTLVVERAG